MHPAIGAAKSHPITSEELFEIYIHLCQYARLIEGRGQQEPLFSIIDKLGQINQRMMIRNGKFEYDDSLARSGKELDNILNRLRKNVDQEKFNKLFYRDKDGNPYRKGQLPIKEYLENLRSVLISWQDPGEGNRDEVDDILYLAKFLISDFEPLTVGINEFSKRRIDGKPSELERGLDLLRVAQYVFGPQTHRLMLLRSLWYYEHERALKVLPLSIALSDLLDYINDLNLISSRQQKIDKKQQCYTPIVSTSHLWEHVPSFLFGNSFLYLPVDGNNDFDNSFFFGYGPMPFNFDSITFLDPLINLDFVERSQYIGLELFNRFDSLLSKYIADKELTDPLINRVTLEMKSYEDIYSVIEEKVINHFVSKKGDTAKNLKDAYNVLIVARRELLSFKGYRVSNMLEREKIEYNIRSQFIEFFRDPTISTSTITFYGCVVDGKLFTFKFDKNEFYGKVTQMNANTDGYLWSAFDKDYIQEYNKEIIDKRVEILKDLIESQTNILGGSKKVRIFIGQNLGTFQGTDYGYQYLESKIEGPDWVPKTKLMSSSDFGPSYVDISFEDGVDQRWEMVKLRYLVLLSLATGQEIATGTKDTRVSGNNYRDFIFIIKKADVTIADQNYIAYFNHKYIRSSKMILPYSVAGAPSETNTAFTRIVLEGPYAQMYWSGEFSSRWAEHNSFIPLWTAARPVRLNLFDEYANFIDQYKTHGLP